MSTLRMPIMDSASEVMIIFISGFLEINLKGLRVLKSLRILRSIPKDMSMSAVITIKKSSFDQLSFK